MTRSSKPMDLFFRLCFRIKLHIERDPQPPTQTLLGFSRVCKNVCMGSNIIHSWFQLLFFEEGRKLENTEKTLGARREPKLTNSTHLWLRLLLLLLCSRISYFIFGMTHDLIWLQAELKQFTERLPAIFEVQPRASEYSPELRHVFGLYVRIWTFLSNLVFFIKSRLLIDYLHVNISFSDNLLDLCDHVTGHALN